MNISDDNGKAKEFTIRYITKEGKRKLIKCIKGTRFVGGEKKTNRTFESVRRKGVIMLYNLIEKRVETPKVFAITNYNGYPIQH
jgi:hypothetical protein